MAQLLIVVKLRRHNGFSYTEILRMYAQNLINPTDISTFYWSTCLCFTDTFITNVCSTCFT